MTSGRLALIREAFNYRQLPVVKDVRLVRLVRCQETIQAMADVA